MARDSQMPDARLDFADFPGLKFGTDIYRLYDGSSHDQVNMESNDIGSMECRRGLVLVSFEGE